MFCEVSKTRKLEGLFPVCPVCSALPSQSPPLHRLCATPSVSFSLFCWLAVPLPPSFLPNPASPLLRLALTRGVCVSPLQCWVALCPSGSRWRLSLPGLRFSPPDLGGMNFSTRPWWFFFWVSNCQFQFWPRRNGSTIFCLTPRLPHSRHSAITY